MVAGLLPGKRCLEAKLVALTLNLPLNHLPSTTPALLPQNCSGSEANNPLLGAGTVGYLSPVPCGKFYRFTWWITW
jgi:hypothetical protein